MKLNVHKNKKTMTMRSIKSQLTTTVLLCILLPTGLIGGAAYSLLYDLIKKNLIEEVGEIADERYEELRIRLRDDNKWGKNLLDSIIASCGPDIESINTCIQPQLEQFIAIHPNASLTFHSGLESDVVKGATGLSIEELNNSFHPGQIAAISISPRSGASLYSVKATDSVSGFHLVSTYPTQDLQEIFSGSQALGQSGETFLTNNKGFFITKPRYSSSQGITKPILSLPMKHCLHHQSGEILDLDYRSIPVIHGFRFVPEIGGGCIMAHIDQAEAFAPLRQLTMALGLVTCLVAFAAWLLATMMSRKITQPLIAVGHMARALSEGDFTHRIPLTGFAEIADLSQLFNSMANQLIDSISQLVASKQLLGKKVVECNTELYGRNRKYYSVIQTTGDGFWQVDKEGVLLEVNPAYARLSGYTEPELIGMRISGLEAQETSEATAEHIRKIIQQGSDTFETRHRRKDGSIWDVEVNASFISEDGGYFVCFFRDITERKQAEQELRIAASAFETQEGIMITDTQGIIVRVNRAFTRITGYTPEEAIGNKASILKSGRHDQKFYRNIESILHRDGLWEGEIWDHHKDGHIYPQWLSMTAVQDEKGQTIYYVSNFSDITERKASEDKIKSLAFYDSLTGLPNRRLLTERLEHAITLNARTGHHGALLFLDLDDFKLLNDTQGHGAGDELLTEVARRLKSCVRKADSVARLGGDEFVVLMEKFNHASEQVAIQVKTVAEKIITVLAEPYLLSSVLHNCSCSIGIVLFNGSDKTASTLMSQADTAMYAAKKTGKNAYRFFDQVMQKELEQRAKFESSLRKAIDNEQFELFYQPQVDDKSLIIGVEALIRWHHPELGLIHPAEFLPLAEETGIILVIGHWVLETACIQLKAWKNIESTRKLSIAVNVSAKQLYQPGFVDEVREVVEKYAIDPSQLKLELTEKMVLEKIDITLGKMLSLKAIGVILSMDDFGIGYSSLSFLRTLPFDQIKVDKSFVNGIRENSTDAFIVSCVLNLGQLLGINVIVEGVENVEQYELLKSMGCTVFQGYFFGLPAPAKELETIFVQGF